ncbi:hypothetical protein JOE33_003006 [Pseudomonas sp. PvP027]|uniref:hypothetical protein n=1 Tax=Pseudomonas TaxID=286 RepID=UPI001655F736|nr:MULTISPECIES: hypothetical protein [Pseudomonas]MBC8801243.1 hypothetical protein [Pseudomonas congelans]MBP1146083.1 hypothetical protein [Pseudomonas sp. PvP027]
MSYQIELGWKIFSNLSSQEIKKTDPSGHLFNIRGASSFIRTLGGNAHPPYVPKTIEPTKNFYQALRGSRAKLHIEEKRFPFTIFLKKANQRLMIKTGIRRYLSCICISIVVESFCIDNLFEAIELQDLAAHRELFEFISNILVIANSGETRRILLNEIPKIVPTTRISCTGAEQADTSHYLAELLTHHTIDDKAIVDSVFSKNKSHQIDKTLVLIDKQGILSYVPPNHSYQQVKGNLQRFQNASSLMEFASAIKRDLRSIPLLKSSIENTSLILSPLTERIITDAKYFLSESISAQRMWELLTLELSMKNELDKLKEKEPAPGLQHINSYEHQSPHKHALIIQQFIGKEFSMGDQYNITGQAGAVGPSSKAENNIFNQALQQAGATLDFAALAAELEILRKSLRAQATDFDHDQAIVSIGAAESSAMIQDGEGALKHLKSAGKWAFDMATEIGTSVAAQAIQKAMGL